MLRNISLSKINKQLQPNFNNFPLFSSNVSTKSNNSAAAVLLRIPTTKASIIHQYFRLTINLLVASDGKAKLVINQGSEYKSI